MDDDARSDASLWRDALAHDGPAFGLIFDRHKDRVFRHAHWQLSNASEAEDAVASAFLELWRRRSDARLVNESLLPWLLVTTNHVCSNLSRSRRRYRSLLDRLPRTTIQELSAEDAALGRAELYDHVDPLLAEAMRELSQSSRDVLVLTVVEGLSVAEAAGVLGMTEGAAKQRLSRARRGLRKRIEDGKALPASVRQS